ncbi:MAG: DTW domain-containing protein [Spirochaetaceae bacterium]
MKIFLLTHLKELSRKTGTGKIAKSILNNSCNIILWKRKEPPSEIIDLDPNNTVLVYPGDEDECENIENITNFILLDGTWQESNKIYNKSPYLKNFKSIKLDSSIISEYALRRNQKGFGLCTIESIIEIYKLKEDQKVVLELKEAFYTFNKN